MSTKSTKKIAIVYHSGYGHTEVQAKAILDGVNSIESITGELFKIETGREDPAKLNDFDGIIFGSPTYMGSVSGQFKTFMDATAQVWFTQAWKDKIASGFTNSGSMSGDKLNTLVQLSIFAAQHSMIWVSLGQLNQSPDGESGKVESINRIGSYLGAMAQSDNAAPDQTPKSGDLETAKLLGQRVANTVLKFNP